METGLLIQNPFAVLTVIVAPAILTSATSVLAMSTINRMLRSREWMHEMLTEADSPTLYRGLDIVGQVNRMEQQGIILLRAMHWIYSALGAFAAASLVALLGALTGQLVHESLRYSLIAAGLLLGVTGVVGLIGSCVVLLRANQISLLNLSEEAALIRARQEQQRKTA